MARNPKYALPGDNIAPAATVTLALGTIDPYNPVARVVALDPSLQFINGAASEDVAIVFDHGSARSLQGFSLHGHNLPAHATQYRIQRNTTNVWTSPVVDVAVPVDEWKLDGFPRGIFVDLLGTGAFQYTRLFIPAISQLVGLGEVCLWESVRTDIINLIINDGLIDGHPARVWRSSVGSKNVYALGYRSQYQTVSFFVDGPDGGAIKDLLDACQNETSPFLWVRDSTKPEGWLASFAQSETKQDFVEGHASISTVIEELSLGLRIPTAPL